MKVKKLNGPIRKNSTSLKPYITMHSCSSGKKGDVALIDNIKIAHWRMNGKQGQRKLMQIQANVFNADRHAAL